MVSVRLSIAGRGKTVMVYRFVNAFPILIRYVNVSLRLGIVSLYVGISSFDAKSFSMRSCVCPCPARSIKSSALELSLLGVRSIIVNDSPTTLAVSPGIT